jgi:8-oxo-dGTP pyrophosphatase MutT (NUDIX family)
MKQFMVDKKQKCPDWFFEQSGVIPYIIENNKIKIMLITSRKGKKWIIPKGVIESGMSPWASAEKEALEEAGITGKIYRKKISEYLQKKWGGECHINVFLMKINKIYNDWDESFRKRKLLSPAAAADKIDIEPLKNIIKNIEKII